MPPPRLKKQRRRRALRHCHRCCGHLAIKKRNQNHIRQRQKPHKLYNRFLSFQAGTLISTKPGIDIRQPTELGCLFQYNSLFDGATLPSFATSTSALFTKFHIGFIFSAHLIIPWYKWLKAASHAPICSVNRAMVSEKVHLFRHLGPGIKPSGSSLSDLKIYH